MIKNGTQGSFLPCFPHAFFLQAPRISVQRDNEGGEELSLFGMTKPSCFNLLHIVQICLFLATTTVPPDPSHLAPAPGLLPPLPHPA